MQMHTNRQAACHFKGQNMDKTNQFCLKWTGPKGADMITGEGPRPNAKRSDI